MKAVYFQTAAALTLTFGIAACVPQAEPPAPPPPPVATPSPTPTPAPPPPPPPVVQEPRYDNYLDAPQTPGTWTYSDSFDGSVARFENSEQTLLAIWCDKDTKQIGIDRSSFGHLAHDRVMRITTETTARNVQASHVRTATMTAAFSPADPLLDAMAITKGRLAIELEGERTLYLPAWVEISRVIEDCR